MRGFGALVATFPTSTPTYQTALVYTPPAVVDSGGAPSSTATGPHITDAGGTLYAFVPQSSNQTATTLTCPPGTRNAGMLVTNLADCGGPAQQQSLSQVLCPDGTYRADAADCPVQCLDGSFAPTLADCPQEAPTPTPRAGEKKGLSTGSILLLVLLGAGGLYYLSQRKKKAGGKLRRNPYIRVTVRRRRKRRKRRRRSR